MRNFDLYTEDWLPVVGTSNGVRSEESLSTVMSNPYGYRLDAQNPQTFSALIDLLVALGSEEKTREYHDEGYLRLFGPKAFMQDDDMPIDQAQDISYLDITSSNYKANLADRRFGDTTNEVSYPDVALWLVRYIRFPLAVRMRISKDDFFTVDDSRAKMAPNLSRLLVYPNWSLSIGEMIDLMRDPNDESSPNLTFDEPKKTRRLRGRNDALTWPARRVKLIPSDNDTVSEVVVAAGITPDEQDKFDASPFAVFTEKGDKHTQTGERVESQIIGDVYPQVIRKAFELGYTGQNITAFDMYADQGRSVRDAVTYSFDTPEHNESIDGITQVLRFVKDATWRVQVVSTPYQGYNYDLNIMSSWFGDRLYELASRYVSTLDIRTLIGTILDGCVEAIQVYSDSRFALPNFITQVRELLRKSKMGDEDKVIVEEEVARIESQATGDEQVQDDELFDHAV